LKKINFRVLVGSLLMLIIVLSSCAPASNGSPILSKDMTIPGTVSKIRTPLQQPENSSADTPEGGVTQSFREYPSVILGKNNWLFWGNPINELVKSGSLSDAQISLIVDELSYISNSLKEQGVDFLFILSPDKYHIYPEFMPDMYEEESAFSSYECLSEALSKADFDFIDCKPLLLDKKKEMEHRLYYLRDRRWNSLGNFLVVQGILSHISKKYLMPEFELLSVDTSEARICTDEIGNDLNNMIQSLSPWQEKGAPEPVYRVQPEPRAPSILWYGTCFSPLLIELMQEGLPDKITYNSLWGEFEFPASLREDISHRLTDQKIVIFEVNEHYRQKISRTLVPEPPTVDFTRCRQHYNWRSSDLIQDWKVSGKCDIKAENEIVIARVNEPDLTLSFSAANPLQLELSRKYYLVIDIISPAITGIHVNFSVITEGQYIGIYSEGQPIYEGDNTVIFAITDQSQAGSLKSINIHIGDKAGEYIISEIGIYSESR